MISNGSDFGTTWYYKVNNTPTRNATLMHRMEMNMYAGHKSCEAHFCINTHFLYCFGVLLFKVAHLQLEFITQVLLHLKLLFFLEKFSSFSRVCSFQTIDSVYSGRVPKRNVLF